MHNTNIIKIKVCEYATVLPSSSIVLYRVIVVVDVFVWRALRMSTILLACPGISLNKLGRTYLSLKTAVRVECR